MRWLYLILGAVVLGAGLAFVANYERSQGLMYHCVRLRVCAKEMAAIARYLKDYQKERGRYPTNDEGLFALQRLARDSSRTSETLNSRSPVHWCRVTDSGILSPWGEPIIYENRHGLEPSLFAFSGATADSDRHYSRKVDEGIFLWSVAARQAHKEYTSGRRRVVAAAVLVVSASLALVALFVRGTLLVVGRHLTGLRRAARLALSFAGGAVVFLVAAVVSQTVNPITSCYAWSTLTRRSPKLTKDYTAVIYKYRERGIISGATYKKITEALNRDDGGRPFN